MNIIGSTSKMMRIFQIMNFSSILKKITLNYNHKSFKIMSAILIIRMILTNLIDHKLSIQIMGLKLKKKKGNTLLKNVVNELLVLKIQPYLLKLF